MEETVLASSRNNNCSLIVATFEGLFVGALLTSQLQGDEAVMRGDLTMDIYEEMCVRISHCHMFVLLSQALSRSSKALRKSLLLVHES